MASVLATGLLGSPAATAQPPAKATRIFTRCLGHFDAGRHTEARHCFRRVYRLYPSPVVLFNLGLTEEKLRHPVQAYQAFLESLAEKGGRLNRTERRKARQRVKALRKRLAFLKVTAEAPSATLSVDGVSREWPDETGMILKPGTHQLIVRARGYRPWREQVRLRPGETHEVVARLELLAAPEAPPPPPPPQEERRSSRLAAWITGGASLALLGTGVAFNVLASSRVADGNALYDRLGADGRPVAYATIAGEYESAADDASTYSWIAVTGYAAAAVGAAVTVWLFLRSPGVEEPARRALLVPTVAPGGGGLVGRIEF